MICPNKNTQEWKNLESAVGEFEAYRLWADNGNEVPSIDSIENNATFKVYNNLKQVLPNLSIKENTEMDVSGRVFKDASTGNPIVEINPQLMKSDTLAHELAHIYIDLLGGMESSLVKAVYNQVKDTGLASVVRRLYSDKVDEVRLQKEVVAKALGMSIDSIGAEESKKNKIQSLKDRIFNWLSKMLGIKQDYLTQMTDTIISQGINQSQIMGELDSEVQNQMVEEREAEKVDPKLNNLKKAIKIAAHGLDVKYKQLSDRLEKHDNPEEHRQDLDSLAELKKNLDKMIELNSLAKYADKAYAQGQAAVKRLKELEKKSGKMNSDKLLYELNFINDYIKTFSHVDSFISGLEENLAIDGFYAEDELKRVEDLLVSLKSAKGSLISTNNSYIRISRKALAKELSKKDKRIIEEHKIIAEREFNLSTNLKGEEKVIALQEYINDYLVKNADKIEQQQIDYYSGYVETIPKDLSFIELWTTNPRSVNEVMMQTLVEVFDKQDYSTRNAVIKANKKAESIRRRYVDYVGNSQDMKKLYEPLYHEKIKRESDGSKSGSYFVLPGAGTEKYKDIKNGKYTGTPVEEMYDFLSELQKTTDKNLPGRFSVGSAFISIDKSAKERLLEKGILTGSKESISEMFKVTSTDVETGEDFKPTTGKRGSSKDVLTDASNKEHRDVPILFRGSMEESEMSFDLLTNVMIDFAQGINYKNKVSILHTVNSIRDVVQNSEVMQREGISKMVKRSLGHKQLVNKPGAESNILQALDNLIEQRLYGISTTSSEIANKRANQAKGYTSFVMLGGNIMSAGSNFLQGRTMIMMEGVTGDEFSVTNVLKGSAKMNAQLPISVGDIGANTVSSKMNLLHELLDSYSDWSGNKITKFSDSNRVRRLTSLDIVTMPNEAAEYHVQSKLLYAFLDATKITNENGELINKNGEVVVNEKDAMSLDEAFEVVEDSSGVKSLKLNELVKGTNKTGVVLNNKGKFDSEVMFFDLKRRLGAKNRQLFGNYRKENKTLMGRNAALSTVEHMRKWLGEGTRYVWGGYDTLFDIDRSKKGLKSIKIVRKEDVLSFEKTFSAETGKFTEGAATTTTRFLLSMWGDLMAGKKDLVSTNWKTLTSAEKKRIYSFTYSAAAIALGWAIAELAAPDDDDEGNVVLAFYARRLYSEMAFYYNPRESLRVLRTPAISMSMIDRTLDVINQLGAPTELYERGRFKDQNKLKIKSLKLTPGASLARDFENSLNFLMNGIN